MEESINNIPEIITIITASISIGIVVITLLNYLNRETKSVLEKAIERIRVKAIENKKNTVEDVIKKSVKEEKQQKQILEIVKTKITSEVSDIKIQLEKEFSKENDPKHYRYNQLCENFENVRNRLKKEIDSLSRRANLNLTIGITASIIAIGFLFYSGWFMTPTFEEKWFKFFVFYLPKLSLLVFLGTFSFYFLNLYKSNLAVIQNYQSELNDVDFKIISLTSLLLSDSENKDENLKQLILANIANKDWNKILKKDETTVEIEKIKVNNEFDNNMIAKVWNIMNVLQSNEKKNE